MKLFEINQAILECTDPETGEVVDIDRLIALNMARDEKIENLALWVKELKAEAKAIRDEEVKLADRRKVAENKAESLTAFLSQELAGHKFSTPKCAISFRTSKSVNVTDVYKLPEDFIRYNEPTPNKKAIAEALKAGQVIEGAELVEKLSTIIK